MNNFERRYLEGLEARDGKIVAHFAVFDKLSHDLGGIKEVVDRSAFDWTLEANPDVLALVDHDSSKPLGRTSAGTLELEVDDRGLRGVISPPDTGYARDLLESIKRGDVTGASFSFRVPDRQKDQRLEYRGDDPVRRLLRVELREVSVVTFPAYPNANDVQVRKLLEELEPRSRMELFRKRLRLAELA